MIDIRASKPLAKAFDAEREAQRHLECLTRKIIGRGKAGDDNESPEPDSLKIRPSYLSSGAR